MLPFNICNRVNRAGDKKKSPSEYLGRLKIVAEQELKNFGEEGLAADHHLDHDAEQCW